MIYLKFIILLSIQNPNIIGLSDGWIKWREASGVLFDNSIPNRLKDKINMTVVKPAIMYRSECWPVNRNIEYRKGVTEMRMLRWMSEEQVCSIRCRGDNPPPQLHEVF